MIIFILVVAAIAISILVYLVTQTHIARRLLGCLLLIGGIFLASLTGSYTSLALPVFGNITLGAGSGAAVGFGTWLVLGTVGVAAGGVGIALGAVGMTLIGAFFGGIGGTASGFGIQTNSYPLVHWIVWVPLIILGIYFLWGQQSNGNGGIDSLEDPE